MSETLCSTCWVRGKRGAGWRGKEWIALAKTDTVPALNAAFSLGGVEIIKQIITKVNITGHTTPVTEKCFASVSQRSLISPKEKGVLLDKFI